MTARYTQTCPVAAAANFLGDKWNLLIFREAFRGVVRFKEFQQYTGIAKNLLSGRLANLVEDGFFRKEDIGEHGQRFVYVLTDKGLSLAPVLAAIHQWSNANLFGLGEEPILLIEKATGKELPMMKLLGSDGSELKPEDVAFAPGPGADEGVIARLGAR